MDVPPRTTSVAAAAIPAAPATLAATIHSARLRGTVGAAGGIAVGSPAASRAATTRARSPSASPAMRCTQSPTSEGRTAGTHASMSRAMPSAVA
ncbi:MAG: hypothetical protein ABSE49_18150 [Polyangiaceae bacterium]